MLPTIHANNVMLNIAGTGIGISSKEFKIETFTYSSMWMLSKFKQKSTIPKLTNKNKEKQVMKKTLKRKYIWNNWLPPDLFSSSLYLTLMATQLIMASKQSTKMNELKLWNPLSLVSLKQ